jgi:hypothetical protein
MKAWLFHEIRTVAFDELIEIFEQRPRAVSLDDREEDALRDNYHQIIEVILELLEDCRHENPEALEPLTPWLLIFCVINNHRFTDPTNRLIAEITGLRPAAGSGSSSQAFVQHQAEDWVLDQVSRFIEIPSDDYVLEWGLCCGDLISARKALEIFQLKRRVINELALGTVLRSIQLVASVLSERTDPGKKQQFDQWLLRVVGDGIRPQFAETVEYLTVCLRLVKHYVEEMPFTPARVFWMAISFLKASTLEYNKIFVSALEIIAVFVRKESLCESLKNAKEDGDLLELMFAVKCDDRNTISWIFDIIQALLTVGLVRILGSLRSTVHLAMFALVPALWNRFNSREKAEEHSTVLANVIGISSTKCWINDICLAEKRSPRSIAEIVTTLLPRISDTQFQLLLNFLGQVVKLGTPSQKEAVYAIAQATLIHNPEADQKVDFATIGSYATLDTELHASPIVKGLLRGLVERGIVVQSPTKSVTGKTWSQFPLSDLGFSLEDWRPDGDDIFSDCESWPPMYMTDPGFSGSTILKAVKAALGKIRSVAPLSGWFQRLLLARGQSTLGGDGSHAAREMPDAEQIGRFLHQLESEE